MQTDKKKKKYRDRIMTTVVTMLDSYTILDYHYASPGQVFLMIRSTSEQFERRTRLEEETGKILLNRQNH